METKLQRHSEPQLCGNGGRGTTAATEHATNDRDRKVKGREQTERV